MDSTVKEDKFQGAEINRRKHERVSGCKNSPGRSAEFWFHYYSGHIRNGRGGWEVKGPLVR